MNQSERTRAVQLGQARLLHKPRIDPGQVVPDPVQHPAELVHDGQSICEQLVGIPERIEQCLCTIHKRERG